MEQFEHLAHSTDEEAMWQNIKDKLTEVPEKFVPQSNTSDAPSWKSKYQYPLSGVTRNAINIKNRKTKIHLCLTIRKQLIFFRTNFQVYLLKNHWTIFHPLVYGQSQK